MTRPSPAASPLVPVLCFTGLSSFAAGTATLGIFFVTDKAYGFSVAKNYALGLLIGVTYMAGALGAGALRRALGRLGLSARALLFLLTGALGLCALVPLVARSGAAVFGLLALYAPLTGVFWPLIESYVSGARRGAELRSAVGRFNVVWSSTLVPSFLAVSPLLARSSSAVFVCIALVHALSLVFLLYLRAEPGQHGVEAAHVVPRSYSELLRVHRVLHATSYLVIYALSPYLPLLLARLGLAPEMRGGVAATWLFARVVTFAVMERWHGWHGRWSVAGAGAAVMLGGFGLTVLAPRLPCALAAVLLGLAAFGVGLAALYTAALYYVFEVGGSAGGGSHEALIGLGYTVGPLCGLVACGLERLELVSSARRDGVLLALIATLSLAGALYAWRHRRETLEAP